MGLWLPEILSSTITQRVGTFCIPRNLGFFLIEPSKTDNNKFEVISDQKISGAS